MDGKSITLLGANIGENLQMPSLNGQPADGMARRYGYGITELSAQQADLYEKFRLMSCFVDGDEKKGKLNFPFLAFENGALLGPFATRSDLEKEVASLVGIVTTGFEGVDPDAQPDVKTSDDAPTKPKK